MPQPNSLNSAVAHACAPRENLDAFVDNAITRAVRYEVARFMNVSDAEIAWIVEATLWHLRHLAEQHGHVDLDYLGEIRGAPVRPQCDTNINVLPAPGARPVLVWIGAEGEEVSADQEITQ